LPTNQLNGKLSSTLNDSDAEHSPLHDVLANPANISTLKVFHHNFSAHSKQWIWRWKDGAESS